MNRSSACSPDTGGSAIAQQHEENYPPGTLSDLAQDRESLLIDAVAGLATTRVPSPGAGDLGADLRRLARSFVVFLNSPAGKAVAAASLSDAGRIPQVADAKRRFFTSLWEQAAPVVSATIARGELPAATDPAELVRTLVAPIYLRLLVTAEPISRATADCAAKVTLAAARAGALIAAVA